MLNPVRRTTFSKSKNKHLWVIPVKSSLLVVPYCYIFKYWCATDFSPLEFLPFKFILCSFVISSLRTWDVNWMTSKFISNPVFSPKFQTLTSSCPPNISTWMSKRALRVTFIDWAPYSPTTQAYSSCSLPHFLQWQPHFFHFLN